MTDADIEGALHLEGTKPSCGERHLIPAPVIRSRFYNLHRTEGAAGPRRSKMHPRGASAGLSLLSVRPRLRE